MIITNPLNARDISFILRRKGCIAISHRSSPRYSFSETVIYGNEPISLPVSSVHSKMKAVEHTFGYNFLMENPLVTATHERLAIAFSIQLFFPMSTIEYHIQVHPHSIRTSRKESCLRCDGGGSVCDKTAITAGATSLMVQYCPTFSVGMDICIHVHRFGVVP